MMNRILGKELGLRESVRSKTTKDGLGFKACKAGMDHPFARFRLKFKDWVVWEQVKR